MKTRYLFLLLALSCKLAWADPNNEAHISVKQLEARISTLEDLLQELQAKQGNPSQVKAPFQVVDASGRIILQVTSDEKDGDLLAMGRFPESSIILRRIGDDANLMVGTGNDSRVILVAKKNGIQALAVEEPAYTTRIGSLANGGGHGLFIRDSGGKDASGNATPTKPLAEIAALDGKKVALRLYNEQEKVVVSAGSNPAAAGAGTLKIANTKGENVAFVGTTLEGENGAMGVAKGGKDVIAMLAEPRLVAVYNDTGAPIVSMGKSDKSDGGNLTTRDPAGEGVFSAGYNSEVGGGDACVYRAKRQNTFCLGIGLPGMMGTMGN